jgi:hypothetical protein
MARCRRVQPRPRQLNVSVTCISHAGVAFTPPQANNLTPIVVGTGGRSHLTHAVRMDPDDEA